MLGVAVMAPEADVAGQGAERRRGGGAVHVGPGGIEVAAERRRPCQELVWGNVGISGRDVISPGITVSVDRPDGDDLPVELVAPQSHTTAGEIVVEILDRMKVGEFPSRPRDRFVTPNGIIETRRGPGRRALGEDL